MVGGGLAGITAALAAADAGMSVTLLEGRPRLGGATFSFRRDGRWLDNGQHVFLRCCTAYRSFLDRIGTAHLVELQDRLDVPVLTPWARPDGCTARAAVAPAPVRRALPLPVPHPRRTRPGRRRRDGPQTPRPGRPQARRDHVRRLAGPLRRHRPGTRRDVGPGRRRHPQPHRRARFARDGRQGLPHRAARHQRRRGHRLEPRPPAAAARRRRAARAGGRQGRRPAPHPRLGARRAARGGFTVAADGATVSGDAVVLAVPHEDAARLLPPGALLLGDRPADPTVLAGLGSSPIVNLHVVYDRPVFDHEFAAGLASPVQWVFDRSANLGLPRGRYLAVSNSAADAEIDMTHQQLRERYLPALERLLPPPATRASRSSS
ncbi:FAD-dependent oxidoreductase [Yinghuangia aomiensis]